MNEVRPRLCVLIVAMVVGVCSQANCIPLQLGIYTPRLPFPDNRSRVTWAQTVGEVLSAESGLSIEVRAFTRSSDLMAFMEAERIQLVLADPAFLVEFIDRFEVLGSGSGPEGHTPNYAVFVGAESKAIGISDIKDARLALVETGRLEVSVLSNFAFEGLINVMEWFGNIGWVADINEAINRIRTKRADAALGYESVGQKAGLRVAVRLQGLPLPALAQVKGTVDIEDEAALRSALRGVGLPLPKVGPMNRLTIVNQATLPHLESAISRPPGQARPRRPVWSPVPVEPLKREYKVKRRGQVQLGPALRRWRRPSFPNTHTTTADSPK